MATTPATEVPLPWDPNAGNPSCANSSLVQPFNTSDAAEVNRVHGPDPTRGTANQVMLGVLGGLTVASYTAFVVLRKRFDRTRVRPRSIPRLAMFGYLCYLLGDALPKSMGYAAFPCWMWHFFDVLVVPLLALSLFMRYAYFILLHRYAQASVAHGGRLLLDAANSSEAANANANANANATTSTATATANDAENALEANARKVVDNATWVTRALWDVTRIPFTWRANSASSHKASVMASPGSPANDAAKEDALALYTLKFVLTYRGEMAYNMVNLAPFILIGAVLCATADPAFTHNCVNCTTMSVPVKNWVIASGVICLLLCLTLSFRVRSLRDPFGFKTEARLCTFDAILAMIAYLYNVFAGDWGPFDTQAQLWDNSIIVTIPLFLIVVHSTLWPLADAAWREGWRDSGIKMNERRKREAARARNAMVRGGGGGGGKDSTSVAGSQGAALPSAVQVQPGTDQLTVDALAMVPSQFASVPSQADGGTQASTAALRLETVLNTPGLRELFEAHVQAEFSSDCFSFPDATETFRRSFFDVGATARLARAKRIAQVFVGNGAVQQVNISDAAARRIRSALAAATHSGAIPREVFDEARAEVMAIVENGALMRFRRTREFAEFERGHGGGGAPA